MYITFLQGAVKFGFFSGLPDGGKNGLTHRCTDAPYTASYLLLSRKTDFSLTDGPTDRQNSDIFGD